MKRIFIIILILLLIVSCGSDDKTDTKDGKVTKWEHVVYSHTYGSISKKSLIRVKFVEDAVSKEMVGGKAKDIFSFEPSIKGTAYWNEQNELTFYPEKNLESGKRYKATLNLKNSIKKAKNLGDFSFDFSVIKQSFEINIDGLSSVAYNDLTNQKLTGSVATADTEDDAKIENVLKATQDDLKLKILWNHSPSGKNHFFTVEGIKRQNSKSNVRISWNGDKIGVDKTGNRLIPVIRRGLFQVSEIAAVTGKQQYIKIRFSDPLLPSQNLRGLITLRGQNLRFKIERNIVKAYLSKVREGSYRVKVYNSIKNIEGVRLDKDYSKDVIFENIKPGVRFVGKGVIIPGNENLKIPFEAVNLNSVQVTALEVFSKNIGQFLQVNKMDGNREIKRVGRFIFRKTIPLKADKNNLVKWTRYSLDATELFKKHPNSLFRLTLSFNRSNSSYPCSVIDRQTPVVKEPPFQNEEDTKVKESSSWDYYYSERDGWEDRRNPCKDAYYNKEYNGKVTVSRNYIASNIGITVKNGGDGVLHVITTDILSTNIIGDVNIKAYNYQNKLISKGKTNNKGFSNLKIRGVPFYLTVEKKGQKGYIKLNESSSLPVSHFDVAGAKVNKGVKGYIYGERGVWRPGDNIFLTFVLEDKKGVLPKNHPVSLDFFNPKGQLIESFLPEKSLNNFHAFKLKTDNSAQTGNWKAVVNLGGLTFAKQIKVETVIPNRLKVKLNYGDKKALYKDDGNLGFKLFGQWLHGAKASHLSADVSVSLNSKPTKFKRFTDYAFDDPSRVFSSSKQTLFNGSLDSEGYVNFNKSIDVNSHAPGMLSASFYSRVFESSGAFSSDSISVPFHPFSNYVGVKMPKGDVARGMLLTDIDHTVKVASINNRGEPVSLKRVKVTLYKISWKWWYDKTSESLANFTSSSSTKEIKSSVISTKNGFGEWKFKVKYPSWGRYLVRVTDLNGNHSTGKIAYIDWPGWAGRAQDDKGPGASVLNFTSDKKKYTRGETATINLPSAKQGRALFTVENGSGVLEKRWISLKQGKNRFSFKITGAMSPNVYACISLLQPHAKKKNDRPIRLYGVIPIMVENPDTILSPVLQAKDELEPLQTTTINISEKNGSPMTYTIAMVDEGLLGLTRFKTANLRKMFNKREALGVRTWDIFDEVTGAYGGDLERLLALGGDDAEEEEKGGEKKEKKRFPPVVHFEGPYTLSKGASNKHIIKIPQYIGAVRIMVVAGNKSAYGLAKKTVPVRKPLMVMATLPRVLSPKEVLEVPVNAFVLDDKIKNVNLKIEVDDHLKVLGKPVKTLSFKGVGDKLTYFKIRVGSKTGKAKFKVIANSKNEKAEHIINIDIRNPNPKITLVQKGTLTKDKNYKTKIIPVGISGTNRITLEASVIPEMGLTKRLNYLIRYPHGCIEQTTSSVFPQLYLSKMLVMSKTKVESVEKNIKAAIERLSSFQLESGGLSYWPGSYSADNWGTTYAGHFLIEASKKGYYVPPLMIKNWKNFQNTSANSWTAGGKRSELLQSYRLYTLALANSPQIGAMNRLKESKSLDNISKFMLSASYYLAGQKEIAKEIAKNTSFNVASYNELGNTYGSGLRDKAIILLSLSNMNEREKAKEIALNISKRLSTGKSYSTQTLAYSLLSLFKYYSGSKTSGAFEFTYSTNHEKDVLIKSDRLIVNKVLKNINLKGTDIQFKSRNNNKIYINIVKEGIPDIGDEVAFEKGLSINTSYYGVKDQIAEFEEMMQGRDFIADISVANTSTRDYENLVLSYIVPSGWEIHNPRFYSGTGPIPGIDYQDIRDDRIYTYFNLKAGEMKRFKVLLNATYLGKFYLPGINVEAMYNPKITASKTGRQVNVALQTSYDPDDSAACPFIYSYDRDGALVKKGTILTNIVGKTNEKLLKKRIGIIGDTLVIKEKEREVSYINYLAIEAVMKDGTKRMYTPDDERLENDDNQYLVMYQGDTAKVFFNFQNLDNIKYMILHNKGYYDLKK
ncbi:MAG: hypothetical protein GY714_02625 [Desulfobacterales bacterium]|nr:hypothetical protein [Desulfobacterales bacterium]